MPIKGFLAALAFIILVFLAAYSYWAEVGPFAWIASVQVAIFNVYETKITWLLVAVIFIVPGIMLCSIINQSGRMARALAYGIPALLVLAHLAGTIYFMSTGGPPAKQETFDEAVRSANFLPRSCSLEFSKLPQLDAAHAAGVQSGHSSSDSADVYVPFESTAPDHPTPVVLKIKSSKLRNLSSVEYLRGTIRQAPVPYLVRRTWEHSHSDLVTLIAYDESVREAWIFPTIVYGIGIIYGAQFLFKSRRSSAAPA